MFPVVVLSASPLAMIPAFTRLRLPLAILVVLLGGYLLLPVRVNINVPLAPDLNKDTLPALVATLMCVFMVGKARKDGFVHEGWFPRPAWAGLLIAALLGGAAMTVLTNMDPVFYGPTALPGLRVFDMGSSVLNKAFTLLPLLLAWKFLAHPREQRLALTVLMVAGLLYSLPTLFEVRMSPLLHKNIYGFFQHSWAQHVRGGSGFRPIVFLRHGLLVSLFFAQVTLVAVGIYRLRKGEDLPRGMVLFGVLWLLGTLIMTKSLGALVIALTLMPVIFFFNVRMQLMVASIIAILILLYPVARSSGVIPLDRIMSFAEWVDPQRAGSLGARLENEDRLTEKANERPLFGWGGWSRSRVFNAQGYDVTIADGTWVIVLGRDGWVGYIGHFGLLVLPIVLLFRKVKQYRIGMETSVLALVLAGNMIDLIPNSGLSPITWCLAGALWGRLALGRIENTDKAEDDPPPAEVPRGPRYSRFEPRSRKAPQGNMAMRRPLSN